MKKYLSLLIILVITVSVFAGCSAANNADSDKNDKTTTPVSTSDKAEGETATYVDIKISDSKKDIKDATLSDAEACEKIKSYSMDKLGLDGKKDDYKFMIATKGKVIDGKDYLEVVASIEGDKNDDGTVTMFTKGTYYISYDGKAVIGRNMSTGELFEIEE